MSDSRERVLRRYIEYALWLRQAGANPDIEKVLFGGLGYLLAVMEEPEDSAVRARLMARAEALRLELIGGMEPTL